MIEEFTQNFTLNAIPGRGNPCGMRSTKRLKESIVEEVKVVECDIDGSYARGSPKIVAVNGIPANRYNTAHLA